MPTDAIRPHRVLRALLLAALVPAAAPAEAGEELRNWYADPFFRISAALPGCPRPAGPFTTEAEMRLEAHHRAEKGTTCWLAKACDRPTAYAYDRDIAAAFRAALRTHPFSGTSLWVTVRGRVVYIEGCATRPAQGAELEAFARALPDVQQAVAILRTDASAPAPYRIRPPEGDPP
jgi:hypothetical protein